MLLITFPDCTNPMNTCVSYFPYLTRSAWLGLARLGLLWARAKKTGSRGHIKPLVLCVGEPSCWPPASTLASDRQTDRQAAADGNGAQAARSVGDGVRTCPGNFSLSFFCFYRSLFIHILRACSPLLCIFASVLLYSPPLTHSLHLHPPPPQSLLDLDVKASQAVWSLSAGCQGGQGRCPLGP